MSAPERSDRPSPRDGDRPSPRDGDRVFHCGHLDVQAHHFYQIPDEPLRFRRPNGTVVEGSWIVLCPACFALGKSPLALVRGDDRWEGDRPVEYKEEN